MFHVCFICSMSWVLWNRILWSMLIVLFFYCSTLCFCGSILCFYGSILCIAFCVLCSMLYEQCPFFYIWYKVLTSLIYILHIFHVLCSLFHVLCWVCCVLYSLMYIRMHHAVPAIAQPSYSRLTLRREILISSSWDNDRVSLTLSLLHIGLPAIKYFGFFWYCINAKKKNSDKQQEQLWRISSRNITKYW